MNTPCSIAPWLRLSVLLLFIAWVGPAVMLAGDPNRAQVRPVVLKHRVEIIAPFSQSPSRQGLDVTLSPGATPSINDPDGVVIQRDEWGSALDELKLILGRSPVIRPAEPVPTEVAASLAPEHSPAFALHARFGRTAGSYRVLLRLVRKTDGAAVVASEGRHETIEQAIAVAVADIEKTLLRRPWRCRVANLIQGQLLIPFGRLDGLLRDQILTGFTLPEELRAERPVLSDTLLLLSGKKAGQYQVSEVTEEIALLRPLTGAAQLQAGDVLEAPAAPLHDLPRSSSSTLWDRIYQK